MAEKTEFLQAIDEAILDADSLEQFINGSDSETVLTRLSAEYPTLQKALKELFNNNGIAERFKTLSDLQASDLQDDSYALVADDADDINGIYIKEGGVWVKSKYDAITASKAYTDSSILDIASSKNKYDASSALNDYRLSGGGILIWSQGSVSTNYIPVNEGEVYTASWSNIITGSLMYSFFDSIGGSLVKKEVAGITNDNKKVITVPSGGKYIVLNIKFDATSAEKENFQFERGSVATEYAPYGKELVLSSRFENAVVSPSQLSKELESLKNKDYEVVRTSKNLFDKDNILVDMYLTTGPAADDSISGALASGAGWSTSNIITVEPGEAYTLSGTRARFGLSFFTDKEHALSGNKSLQYIGQSNLPLTVVAPQEAGAVVFSLESPTAKGFDNIQFEKGSVATSYTSAYGDVTLINPEYIDGYDNDNVEHDKRALFSVASDGSASISSNNDDFNVRLDVFLGGTSATRASQVFNFGYDYINGVRVKDSTDDISPIRMDGTTLGANHGFYKSEITASHDKTNADVGSIWSDGDTDWLIISVGSGKLGITMINGNSGFAGSQLTHKSGATNTSSITVTSTTNSQWYPLVVDREQSVYIDDVLTNISSELTAKYSKSVTVHESYYIPSKGDLTAWIIANGGKELKEYHPEPSVLFQNSYVFDTDAGCTIYSNMTCLKQIGFINYMGVMSGRIDSNDRVFYIPKTTSVVSGDKTFNLQNIQAMPNDASTSSIVIDSSSTESSANPPDRLLQMTQDFGFANGYLPVLDAEPTVRATNASKKYMELRGGTLKYYPSLIDNEKNILNVGDSYSCVGYRKYFKRGSKRTADYVIESHNADYLYLDWHSATTDIIDLDHGLSGREFEVHEKSDNVELLSNFTPNKLAVSVDSSKSYGYLVLRFDK